MATAPKAALVQDAPELPKSPKSKRKLILIATTVLLLAGGSAGAWFFMSTETDAAGTSVEAKTVPAKPPVFTTLEQFTVNLQPDDFGEQYLQTSFTLQVANQATVDQIKLYMPLVRSRLLFLLSSKKASELATVEGKNKLADEIVAQVKQPFIPNGQPQEVTGVFFTSFVIQ